MHLRDIVAGALLVNAIPHAVMGGFGKRLLTPVGGEESSPGLNLVWSGLNAGAGVALLSTGGWRDLDQRTAAHRLVGVEVGSFAMLCFGMGYELAAGRRKRRLVAGNH